MVNIYLPLLLGHHHVLLCLQGPVVPMRKQKGNAPSICLTIQPWHQDVLNTKHQAKILEMTIIRLTLELTRSPLLPFSPTPPGIPDRPCIED